MDRICKETEEYLRCDTLKLADRIEQIAKEQNRDLAVLQPATSNRGLMNSLRRKEQPELNRIVRIASALNVSIDYLVGATEIKPVATYDVNSLKNAVRVLYQYSDIPPEEICDYFGLPPVKELT